jgi:hypothetical protein
MNTVLRIQTIKQNTKIRRYFYTDLYCLHIRLIVYNINVIINVHRLENSEPKLEMLRA